MRTLQLTKRREDCRRSTLGGVSSGTPILPGNCYVDINENCYADLSGAFYMDQDEA